MRTECRRCGSTHYPLTPGGYCYLCFSHFGSATQIAMLLLAYNAALTVEGLRRCLGFGVEEASTAEYLWQMVRLRLEEEARNK